MNFQTIVSLIYTFYMHTSLQKKAKKFMQTFKMIIKIAFNKMRLKLSLL